MSDKKSPLSKPTDGGQKPSSAPASDKEQAVAKTTTKGMVQARFKDFNAAVAYFQSRMEDVSKSTLRICWELGREVNAIKESAVYGKTSVADFAEKLNNPTIDDKTLWRYGQFAHMYTEEDLNETLKRKHVGWGAINKLLGVKDKEDRKLLETQLDNGELKPSKLEEKLREYKEEQEEGGEPDKGSERSKGSKESARNYTKAFKTLADLCRKVDACVELCRKDIDDLNDALSQGEDKYELIKEAMAEASISAGGSATNLAEFVDAAEKAS